MAMELEIMLNCQALGMTADDDDDGDGVFEVLVGVRSIDRAIRATNPCVVHKDIERAKLGNALL